MMKELTDSTHRLSPAETRIVNAIREAKKKPHTTTLYVRVRENSVEYGELKSLGIYREPKCRG